MAASRRRDCEARLRAERERVRRNEEPALRVFSSRRPGKVTLRQFAFVILRYHAALFKFGGLRQQSIEILVLLWTFGELRRGNLIDVLHSDKDSLSRALVPLTERNMIAADRETLRIAKVAWTFYGLISARLSCAMRSLPGRGAAVDMGATVRSAPCNQAASAQSAARWRNRRLIVGRHEDVAVTPWRRRGVCRARCRDFVRVAVPVPSAESAGATWDSTGHRRRGRS